MLKLLAPLALLLPSPLAAQVLTKVLAEGDDAAGVGLVTSIETVRISNTGEWLIEVDTDFADPDRDGALLLDGPLYLREGDPVAGLIGTTYDEFQSMGLADDGGITLTALLADGDASGETALIAPGIFVQSGTTSAISGLTAGTEVLRVFDVTTTSLNDSLAILTVDDPAIASPFDQILLNLATSGFTSAPPSVFAKEGDPLPNQTETVEKYATNPNGLSFSTGSYAMFYADLTGPEETDGVIYRGGTLLAQEGSASPISGRTWADLSTTRMDVNGVGSYVFAGRLAGDPATDALLVKDGAKLVQEGDSPPAIAPFRVTAFGTGPVCIGDTGSVLWWADWDDPDTTRDTGLFYDGELVLQEGVTQVDGLTVTAVKSGPNAYVLSSHGRFAIATVELAGSVEAAVAIDFGLGNLLPIPHCLPPVATLEWTAGAPVVGGSLELTLSGAPHAGMIPMLGLAVQPYAKPSPVFALCGQATALAGAEVLLFLASFSPFDVLVGAGGGSAPSVYTIPVPDKPSLAGATFFAQGLYVDPVFATGVVAASSNGFEITFAP